MIPIQLNNFLPGHTITSYKEFFHKYRLDQNIWDPLKINNGT